MEDLTTDILKKGVGSDELLDTRRAIVGKLFDGFTLSAKSRAQEPENTDTLDVSCAMGKDGAVIFRTGSKLDNIYAIRRQEFLSILTKKFPKMILVNSKNDAQGKPDYRCWSLGDYLLRERQVDPLNIKNNKINADYIWTVEYKGETKKG